MKMIRSVLIPVLLTLFSASVLHAQDLSRYRKFALGTSLTDLSKQVGPYSHETILAHERPAVIQEMTFWPVSASRSATGLEPVSQILFSFYNGELYRMLVTYDREAVQGLTDDDMVQAISARYGTATKYYPEINLPTSDVYAPGQEVVAGWQDSQSAVNLLRSSPSDGFELLIFSKQLSAQAEIAIAESVKLDLEERPREEFDRQEKEASGLEVTREKNKKAFRP